MILKHPLPIQQHSCFRNLLLLKKKNKIIVLTKILHYTPISYQVQAPLEVELSYLDPQFK